MKRLLTVLAILAALIGNSRADDLLSEDERESLIAKAIAFQNIARGKTLQVQLSSEITLTSQVPENSNPDTKKLLKLASPQKIKHSLVTDGVRFCGSSDLGGGKKLDLDQAKLDSAKI